MVININGNLKITGSIEAPLTPLNELEALPEKTNVLIMLSTGVIAQRTLTDLKTDLAITSLSNTVGNLETQVGDISSVLDAINGEVIE